MKYANALALFVAVALVPVAVNQDDLLIVSLAALIPLAAQH